MYPRVILRLTVNNAGVIGDYKELPHDPVSALRYIEIHQGPIGDCNRGNQLAWVFLYDMMFYTWIFSVDFDKRVSV